MRTNDDILEIARRWLRKPPSPREYSNGALQDEIADVMHWVKEAVVELARVDNGVRLIGETVCASVVDQKLPAADALAVVNEIVRAIDLGEPIERKPCHTSGGEPTEAQR